MLNQGSESGQNSRRLMVSGVVNHQFDCVSRGRLERVLISYLESGLPLHEVFIDERTCLHHLLLLCR